MLTGGLLISPSGDGGRTLGIDAHQGGQLVSEVRPVSQDILLVPGIPVLGSGEKICSPPPKMKKTCGENEKLPARLFIKLDGTGITEFDNPVKPALNLYLVGR
jgi:hypothetical protein